MQHTKNWRNILPKKNMYHKTKQNKKYEGFLSTLLKGHRNLRKMRSKNLLLSFEDVAGNMVCLSKKFSSVQSLSRVWLFATPWTAACQASLSITSSWNLLKLMSIESVMPSNHLILCRPLLLVPSIFPSIRVFSDESALHIRWTYCSFSFIISPSNENTGLISFRIGLFVNSVGLTSLKSSHQFKLRSSITFGQKCFELWCICWETCSDDLSMKGAWVRHTFPCI